MSAPHLLSAAAALERILAKRHPEHQWIVSVREDGDVSEGAASAPVASEDACAAADYPDPLGHGNGVAATGLAHHDRFEKAA